MNAGGPEREFMKYFDVLDQKLAPRTLGQRDSPAGLNAAPKQGQVALKHHGTMLSRAAVEGFPHDGFGPVSRLDTLGASTNLRVQDVL
jgi:hypothetical protein